jgi:hypothetical protein
MHRIDFKRGVIPKSGGWAKIPNLVRGLKCILNAQFAIKLNGGGGGDYEVRGALAHLFFWSWREEETTIGISKVGDSTQISVTDCRDDGIRSL